MSLLFAFSVSALVSPKENYQENVLKTWRYADKAQKIKSAYYYTYKKMRNINFLRLK